MKLHVCAHYNALQCKAVISTLFLHFYHLLLFHDFYLMIFFQVHIQPCICFLKSLRTFPRYHTDLYTLAVRIPRNQ
eukprot:SAG31_NODE_688_length_12807_cov_6.395814_7_plen_76_part_00